MDNIFYVINGIRTVKSSIDAILWVKSCAFYVTKRMKKSKHTHKISDDEVDWTILDENDDEIVSNTSLTQPVEDVRVEDVSGQNSE